MKVDWDDNDPDTIAAIITFAQIRDLEEMRFSAALAGAKV